MARARCVTALLVGALLLPSGAAAQDFESRGFRLATPSPRESTAENLAAGKALYEEYCEQCHGAAGDGQGLMADLLDPRPRDFRRGVYKIRTTIQGELPTDLDLFQIVGKGMPGTSMPEWQGILSDEEIWQVVGLHQELQRGLRGLPRRAGVPDRRAARGNAREHRARRRGLREGGGAPSATARAGVGTDPRRPNKRTSGGTRSGRPT